MQEGRNKGIDYLRGGFILLIFISHSADFDVIGSQSIWGAAGVTGFFILSGFLYCDTNKAKRYNNNLWKGCLDEVVKFFAKFYPFYFVMLCVYAFIRPGTYVDFIKCIFLSQSFWGNVDTAMSFNGNAWFLSSLMFCYAIAPILNKLIRNMYCVNLAILMVGAFLIQLMIPLIIWGAEFNVGYYWVYICPFVRALDFFEGMLLAMVIKYRSNNESFLLKAERIFGGLSF